jgi:hypothetical protein
MLCELKLQFDVLSYARAWDGYRLLVLPDRVTLDEGARRKLRAHLDGGGAVLASGWSGLDPDRADFALTDWGLHYEGEDPHDPAYYAVGPALRDGIPDMPHNFYCSGTAVHALPGTDVHAHIVAPYFNRHWDGEHGFTYMPPDRATDRPAVTVNGAVAHITHPVFETYHETACVPQRQLVANLVKALLPDPLVRAPGLPSYARVTVTSQPGRRMVHLLAYVPERRGPHTDMIEEPIELRDVRVSLRTGEREPQRVFLAPSRQELPVTAQDGYTAVTVPVVRGHALVVFEVGDTP